MPPTLVLMTLTPARPRRRRRCKTVCGWNDLPSVTVRDGVGSPQKGAGEALVQPLKGNGFSRFDQGGEAVCHHALYMASESRVLAPALEPLRAGQHQIGCGRGLSRRAERGLAKLTRGRHHTQFTGRDALLLQRSGGSLPDESLRLRSQATGQIGRREAQQSWVERGDASGQLRHCGAVWFGRVSRSSWFNHSMA